MTDFKPSLYNFLVNFQLIRKERKKNNEASTEAKGGKETRSIKSVTATRGRNFIRDNEINEDTLEKIWKDNQNRQDKPFYALSCLKIKTEQLSNGNLVIGYHINVNDEEINNVFLDILSSIAKAYREMQKKAST